MNVKEVIEVNGGKRKQDISVADATATGLVILWESVGGLTEGASYHLVGFMTREYRSKKYLCMA